MAELRQFTTREFFDHPDVDSLIEEYAVESSIAGLPPPAPSQEMYEVMEQAELMFPLVAFEGDRMIGFLVLLVVQNPHYNVPIGVVESYFVASQYRATGAGLKLRHLAENLAQSKGAKGLLISATAGSRLEAGLDRSKGYRKTNVVFFKGFE